MNQILDEVKSAMKAKDQRRLTVLRLITAAIKQQEISNRTETARDPLTEAEIVTVLEKMIKQRRDSIEQFKSANRADLAEQEAFEVGIIEEFMPAQLSSTELEALINQSFELVQPKAPADMGKVMNHLKPLIQGRADMRVVSELVKKKMANA